MNKYLNNTTAQIKVLKICFISALIVSIFRVKWKRYKELSMSADVLED